jgi:tRNA pseudouridine38-40 synthase
MRIALKIAYLGGNYYGFQRQPDLSTIDSEIRSALEQIGVVDGDFEYAGRTDRGVSALGQVIDFSIDEEKAHLARPRCVNGRLPRDIWAWAQADVPGGFDSRRSAIWREYRYILWRPGLDLELMCSCAKGLMGEHDFENFSSCKEDTVRKILRLNIASDNGLFVFDVRADGFLWNMVRRIVRALEMIGSGEKEPEWIYDLLDVGQKCGAPAAPAEGLILMEVGYEGIEWQADEYSMKRAAKALTGTVRRRMSSANVARSIQRAMEIVLI